MHKAVAVFNLWLLYLVDLQSACYCAYLHGVHNIKGEKFRTKIASSNHYKLTTNPAEHSSNHYKLTTNPAEHSSHLFLRRSLKLYSFSNNLK
jgi:hypothetical protein